MQPRSFDAVVAYMGSLWGRELSFAQRAAGLKLLKDLPDEAVEGAVVAIAESGRETVPPWPLVYKTAQSLAERIRERTPQLPASGDSMTDMEHNAAMIRLRAKQTPEQRRRAEQIFDTTRHLAMGLRVRLAQELLAGEGGRIPDRNLWDRLLQAKLTELAALAAGGKP